jgi:hypothetical protein
MSNRFAFACLMLLSAFCISGCVSTTLVYSPNVYQTGRILGGEKLKVRGGLEAAPAFVTSPETQSLSTLAKSDEHGLLLSFGLHKGIFSRTDIGAELGFSPSVSTRVYLKTQLTPVDKRFALSVMPALIYASGTHQTDATTGEDITSEAYGVELHLPMSYSVSKSFDWTWTPKLAYLHFDAPYKNNPPQEDNLPPSMTRKFNLACAGFAFGFRYGIVQPEISVLHALNPPHAHGDGLSSPQYAFGIALHR